MAIRGESGDGQSVRAGGSGGDEDPIQHTYIITDKEQSNLAGVYFLGFCPRLTGVGWRWLLPWLVVSSPPMMMAYLDVGAGD